jgi:tetratricopeptide (TPR) repeat protein
MEQEMIREKRFVPAILPWLAGIAGLIFYSVTLNRWLSLGGLEIVGKVSGWNWLPSVTQPLYYLVTLPFRLLPVTAIPLALNVFTSVCASLTLVLMARSVALLPHDRTDEQRQREKSRFSMLSTRTAWVPVVLAGLVCGLQLTFWENATAASSEMFDLLVFAYVVRCLLEFRIDEKESWLTRAALIYGAGITNNWAMIGFFPIFLVALVWIKKFRFFELRFLGRMALFGLIGLSLYFLLPLFQAASHSYGFWQVLKSNLAMQKTAVVAIPFSKYVLFGSQKPLWVLGLTSLLPILVISLRWPSYFGDSSSLGIALATWIFHIVHGILLVVCLWVMFDPAFSPRRLGYGLPLLTLYYLTALSIGYLSGYFLLVFTSPPNRAQRTPAFLTALNQVVRAGICLLLILVPAGLIYKNLPQIKITNGPALRQYASTLAGELPKTAVVLSDDPVKLFLAESWFVSAGKTHGYIFLDSQSLKWPQYHQFLHKKYSGALPYPQGNLPVEKALRYMLIQLAQTNAVYYLHPSFGYYFEDFYPIPHGLVYELKPYLARTVNAPLLDDAVIAENENFWEKADKEILRPLLPAITPPAPGGTVSFRQRFDQKLHLVFEPNSTAAMLARFCSQSLNFLGVAVQRAGRLDAASDYFALAARLNPDNVVAQINLAYNKNLREGQHASVQLSEAYEDRLGKYSDILQASNANGPFDEPTFCFQQGRVFAQGALLRQAAQSFDRVKTLAPDNIPARVWLAQIYVAGGLPDMALTLINEVHSFPESPDASTRLTTLLVESLALFSQNDAQKAERLLQAAMAKDPKDENLLALVFQVYTQCGRFTNALGVVENQLKLKPDDADTLVNEGYLFLRLGNYSQAIPPLTRVIAIQTNNYSAWLNRAIAYLQDNKLDEAQRDYETLEKANQFQTQVYYGLGEIAYRKKDTNAAIHFYKLYFQHCSPNTPETRAEAQSLSDRLKQLQAGPP